MEFADEDEKFIFTKLKEIKGDSLFWQPRFHLNQHFYEQNFEPRLIYLPEIDHQKRAWSHKLSSCKKAEKLLNHLLRFFKVMAEVSRYTCICHLT